MIERQIDLDIISHVNNVIDDCYLLLKESTQKNARIINSILEEALLLRNELIKKINPLISDREKTAFEKSLNYRVLQMYGRLNGL